MRHEQSFLGTVAGNEPAAAGRSPASLEARSPESINPLHLDSGLMLCGECMGSPNQYELDVGERCSCCNGEGSVADPDYIDGEAQSFDAHLEWGTERHHRRHV